MIKVSETRLTKEEAQNLLRSLLAVDGSAGSWEAANAIILAGIGRPEPTAVELTPLMRSAVQAAIAHDAPQALQRLRRTLRG
jgi:hypothetical protein